MSTNKKNSQYKIRILSDCTCCPGLKSQASLNLFSAEPELYCLLEKIAIICCRDVSWHTSKNIIEHFLDIRKVIVHRSLNYSSALTRQLVIFINEITYRTPDFFNCHVIRVDVFLFLYRF